jgi:hypothetical protein
MFKIQDDKFRNLKEWDSETEQLILFAKLFCQVTKPQEKFYFVY